MPDGRLILETDRLLIREFTEGDVDAFYRLGSDPDVTRYTGDRLQSRAEALEVLRTRPLADYRLHGFGRWACILKADGELIGFAGPKYLDDLREVDLGYRFLPRCWGQGLATEAARAVVIDAYSRLDLRRMIGLVDPANIASARVLEKVGGAFDRLIDYHGHPTARYLIAPPPPTPS